MPVVKVHSGVWSTCWHPKKASTAFAAGQLVDLVSGYIQPSTSSTTQIFGVNQDSTYASSSATTVKIPVLVPRGLGVVEMDVTGTFAATNVGDELDLTDADTVNAAASTTDAVVCVGYISATRGLFGFNTPQFE